MNILTGIAPMQEIILKKEDNNILLQLSTNEHLIHQQDMTPEQAQVMGLKLLELTGKIPGEAAVDLLSKEIDDAKVNIAEYQKHCRDLRETFGEIYDIILQENLGSRDFSKQPEFIKTILEKAKDHYDPDLPF